MALTQEQIQQHIQTIIANDARLVHLKEIEVPDSEIIEVINYLLNDPEHPMRTLSHFSEEDRNLANSLGITE